MNMWCGTDEKGIERFGTLVIQRKPDKYFIQVTSYKGLSKVITLYEVSKCTIKSI